MISILLAMICPSYISWDPVSSFEVEEAVKENNEGKID